MEVCASSLFANLKITTKHEEEKTFSSKERENLKHI